VVERIGYKDDSVTIDGNPKGVAEARGLRRSAVTGKGRCAGSSYTTDHPSMLIEQAQQMVV
jgi:hypothetical protein